MAHIKQPQPGVWPPAAPKNDPDPNCPTTAPTQSRVLLHQRFDQNHGVWIADFLAGPNPDGVTPTNPDGFMPGTYYTLVGATQFTGVG